MIENFSQDADVVCDPGISTGVFDRFISQKAPG
jgi:hypothetical protein